MALIRRVRTIRKNRIGRRRLLEQQAHDPLARGVRASIVARGLDGLEELFYSLFDNLWDALETLLRWFLLGAVIVFPIWLIARLMKTGRS